MPRYRVTITGKDYDAMADLVRKHQLNIAGHSARKLGVGKYVADAFADPDQIRVLERAGYRVERHEDVRKAGQKRQKEVGKAIRAPGFKTVAQLNHYLNVADIESSLAAA